MADKEELGTIASENDLLALNLTSIVSDTEGAFTLSAAFGGSNIRVWTSANKGTEIALPHTWTSTGQIPSTVYIEGIENSMSERDIELRYRYTTGSTAVDDRVKLTLYEMDLVVGKFDSDGNIIVENGNNKYISAPELKVGKMEGAISNNGTLNIDADVDCFYVTISPALPGTADFMLSTVDSKNVVTDDKTKINLLSSSVIVCDGEARTHTEGLLLVSDDNDDDHTQGNIPADDSDDDRTHKVELGGRVVISDINLTIRGNNYSFPSFSGKKTVEIKKTLNVDVILVRNHVSQNGVVTVASNPPISEAALKTILENDRAVYSQLGVDIQFNLTTVNPPAYVQGMFDLINGLDRGGNSLSQEERTLLDAYGTPGTTNDLKIFVVKQFNQSSALGYAIAPFFYTSFSDRKYHNNMFVHANPNAQNNSDKGIANPGDRWTAAHELGHILTNMGHYPSEHPPWTNVERTNVMIPGGNVGFVYGQGSTPLLDSKRWVKSQETIILNSGF